MSEAALAALLSAICWVESGHKVDAINLHDNGSPSLGMCQVKYETARWLGYRGSPRKLWLDPMTNTYYASLYLRWQLRRYRGDAVRAVASYNAGSANGEIKNMGYVRKVFRALGERR
jgi:soluble lytic murein transglycosylase-like protein